MLLIDLINYLISNNPLYYYPELIQPSKFEDNDKLKSLLKDYKIQSINSNLKENLRFIKLYYYNIKSIHNLLYNLEIVIDIVSYDNNPYNPCFSFLFYLSLLIRDNKDIINYSYPIEYIKRINMINKTKDWHVNRKILISKIILELVYNYKGLIDNNDNNNYKDEIENIEKDNMKIIEDNIHIFIELDLNWNINDIKEKKIDEIYAEIIIALIKNHKLEESKNILIEQLDLESIDITKIMFEKISYNLDNNETINKEYLISKEDDLFDDKKINFYFVLIKYILKSTIFIYQINFLFKTRQFIIELIKSKSKILSCFKINNTEEIHNMKEILLEIIVDSKYYLKRIDELNNIDHDNEGNSNNNINTPNEKLIPKNENDNKDITYKNNTIIDNKITSINKTNASSINSINTLIESSVSKSNYSNSNNNQITHKDSNYDMSKREIKIKKKKNIINLESVYSFFNISKRNPSYISALTYSKFLNLQKEEEEELEEIDGKIKYRFLLYIKTINKNKKQNNAADFAIEINKYLISVGANVFSIYNETYQIITEKKLKDWVYNIFEQNNENSNFNNNIILICTKKRILLYDLEKKVIIGDYYNNDNFLFLLETKNNNYFCCCENSVILFSNLINRVLEEGDKKIFKDKLIKSAIKINDLILFKSNKVASKGEDKLTFYNFITNEEIKTNIKEEESSFVFSSNGLTIMPDKAGYKFKVVLCACKKYLKKQKNGILLININLIENDINSDNISHCFYDTKNFEVYCFCPISIIEDKNMKINILKRDKYCTEYFLVGGYQRNLNKGKIKLYKVVYSNNFNDTKIEFIDDIAVSTSTNSRFKGFKGPISCITQANKDGKLIVTCWDGNVYLFESPNIEYYLRFDIIYENNLLKNFGLKKMKKIKAKTIH